MDNAGYSEWGWGAKVEKQTPYGVERFVAGATAWQAEEVDTEEAMDLLCCTAQPNPKIVRSILDIPTNSNSLYLFITDS